MATTAFVIVICLVGGTLFKGTFPLMSTANLSYTEAQQTSMMDTLVNIFPKNIIEPLLNSSMLLVRLLYQK